MYQHNYYRNKKTALIKRKGLRILLLSVIVPILALFLIYSVDLLIHRGNIYPHVTVMSQVIGKMNKVQAKQVLTPVAEKMLSNSIIIQYNSVEKNIIPQEILGASIDVEELVNEAYSIARRGTLGHRLKERISLIRQDYQIAGYLNFNEEYFDAFFSQLQSQIEQPAGIAALDSGRVIPARIGITLDREKLLMEIQKSIIDSINPGTSGRVILPVHYQQPDISTSELLAKIGVYQTISTFETSLQGKEENTLFNIQKASDQINGIILEPGESFIFNRLIGPAEKEDGYKESTIIANGQFVNGYGGGVCQVSTTLYNAALLANLQIIERYNHSIYGDATNYVPLGRDAAIFYGYKDLKFKNSLEQQLVIFCEVKENSLATTIFGERSLDKDIKIITQDKKIHDYDIIEIKRENMEYAQNEVLQEGIPGYSVNTYRVIIDSKGESMEFLSNDQYVSVPMKVLVD